MPKSASPATFRRIPAREFVGKEVVIAARAIGPKGRAGAWSNLATCHRPHRSCPPACRGRHGQRRLARVEITEHTSAGRNGASARLTEGEKDPPVLGNAGGPSCRLYHRVTVQRYSYTLQRAIEEQVTPRAKSAATVSLTPKDSFARNPAGLTAVAGIGRALVGA
ncbi:MAG: hypothetical protein QM757_19375 [Paludibaculum sp.]